MGCTASQNIDIKRSRIQLFQADGEENCRQSKYKKDCVIEQKKDDILKQLPNGINVQQTVNMSNSQELPKPKSIPIKTMTFNIANQDNHSGFSKYRARNIAKHIAEVKPDIIGFQELRENTCIKSNQLERILKELQKIQSDFRWYSVWVPSMIYKKAGISTCCEGLGVMSRFPIKNFKQQPIPHDKNGRDANERAMLIVEFEDLDLQVCVTHLSYADEMQIDQTKDLRKFIDSEYVKSEVNLNQIILGDFNYHDELKAKFLLEDEELRGFKDTAMELKNLQNTWNLYRYDRIYYRGRSLIPSRIFCQEGCQCGFDNSKQKHSNCMNHYCSDHQSLCSEFMYEF